CKNTSCTFLCKCDPQKCLNRNSNNIKQKQSLSNPNRTAKRSLFVSHAMLTDSDEEDENISVQTSDENESYGEEIGDYSEAEDENGNSINVLFETAQLQRANSHDGENDDF
ncbi:unnamed protein product, partial [Didymodactylos carnosus]